jgi:hypothetical protein
MSFLIRIVENNTGNSLNSKFFFLLKLRRRAVNVVTNFDPTFGEEDR